MNLTRECDCMKALKIWGWLLVVISIVLSGYGWISGEFNGHGIASSDNVDLMLTICSIICALLAITVFVIVQAIKQTKEEK